MERFLGKNGEPTIIFLSSKEGRFLIKKGGMDKSTLDLATQRAREEANRRGISFGEITYGLVVEEKDRRLAEASLRRDYGLKFDGERRNHR